MEVPERCKRQKGLWNSFFLRQPRMAKKGRLTMETEVIWN